VNLDLRTLQLLVAVVEEQTVAKAATLMDPSDYFTAW
jgi:hypothetical protein